MTAPRPVGPVPWRVKLKTRGSVWLSPPLTEAEAVAETTRVVEGLVHLRDGTGLITFVTRYGVTAYVRAREVWSVEPVGPRWDGVDDFGKHANVPDAPADDVPAAPEDVAVSTPAPSVVTDGTTWLQTRTRQAEARPRGVR